MGWLLAGYGRVWRGGCDQVASLDAGGQVFETVACPNLAYQLADVVLLGIEYGLYQNLECRILCLEAVDILLVNAFASMVRVRGILAVGQVDARTGGALGEVSVTFALAPVAGVVSRMFDGAVLAESLPATGDARSAHTSSFDGGAGIAFSAFVLG